jgi:tetratricopeptide (TPR) repeat protein
VANKGSDKHKQGPSPLPPAPAEETDTLDLELDNLFKAGFKDDPHSKPAAGSTGTPPPDDEAVEIMDEPIDDPTGDSLDESMDADGVLDEVADDEDVLSVLSVEDAVDAVEETPVDDDTAIGPPPKSPPVAADVKHAAPAPAPAPAPTPVRAAAPEPTPPAPAPAPAPKATAKAPAPSPAPVEDGDDFLTNHKLFREETQRLVKNRDWERLAGMISAALSDAAWASLPETRAAMLLDQSRIYRDRLKDLPSAEDSFRALAALDAARPEVIEFLSARYKEKEDWQALCDLYAAAVEATWDPNQRLAWTREIVDLATTRLRSTDIVIEAWERLWRLGDGLPESSAELSSVYRRMGRWDRLAEFMEKRADASTSEGIVVLREVAEAYLSGVRDHDKAAAVLGKILAARAEDPIALLAMARVMARRKDWEGLAALGTKTLAVSRAALLDFRRLVADALWTAGDLERAIAAHENVLALDPTDADALKAKEEYLERTGKLEDLVGFLAERATPGRSPTVS